MNDDQEDQPVDPPPAWVHLLPSPILHRPVTSEYKRRRGRNRNWWKHPLPPPANDDPL